MLKGDLDEGMKRGEVTGFKCDRKGNHLHFSAVEPPV